jgi:hypothetical protein
VPRKPKGFHNYCRACNAELQRAARLKNYEKAIARSRANYQKHAEKRRAESAQRKKEHPEYYALAEWFRKKKIPISQLDPADLQALIEMKKALKQAKQETKTEKP